MNEPSRFVGIDVSKHTLDVHVLPSGEHWTLANTDHQEIAGLAQRLNHTRADSPVVLEATNTF